MKEGPIHAQVPVVADDRGVCLCAVPWAGQKRLDLFPLGIGEQRLAPDYCRLHPPAQSGAQALPVERFG